MDPGVDPWCLTGPPLPRLLRTYEDARVLGLTLQVWREVCWPNDGSLLALLRAATATQASGGQQRRSLWRAAHGRAYVKALEYILRHDLDTHCPEDAGAEDYMDKEAEKKAAAAAKAAVAGVVEMGQWVSQKDLEEMGLGSDGDDDDDEEGEGEEDDDQPPSLGALLGETLRVAFASILLDYSQLPFLNVTVSALAGRGRLPALQALASASSSGLQGFLQAWRAMWAQEGEPGFYAGAVPVCLMGLLHNWDLLAAHLTGEGDDGTGTGGGSGDGSGGAWVSTGALAKRISSGYLFSSFSPTSSLSFASLSREASSQPPPPPPQPPALAPYSNSTLRRQHQHETAAAHGGMHHSHETAHLSQLAGASIGMSMSISITPPSHASASGLHPAAASAAAAAGAAAAAASSSSSNHHYQQQQQQHGKNGSSSNKNKRGPSFWPPNGLESAAFIAKLGREQEQGREQGEEASTSSSRGVGGALATAAKGTTGKALPRLFRALLTHPLQLWALACITDPDPRFRAPLATSPWASLAHLRTVVGGWRGLWNGCGTTLLTALLPAPFPHLALPFLLRSRQMLAVLDSGKGKGGSDSSSSSSGQGGLVATVRALMSKEGLREVFAGWQALAWGVLPSMAALLAARAVMDVSVGEGPRKRRRWALRRARVRRVMARQLAREMRKEARAEEQAQEQQQREREAQAQANADANAGAQGRGFQRRRPLVTAPPGERQQLGQSRPQVQYRYFDEEPTTLPLPPPESALRLLPSSYSSSPPPTQPPRSQEEAEGEHVSLPPPAHGQGLAGPMRAVGTGTGMGVGVGLPPRRQPRLFFSGPQPRPSEGDGEGEGEGEGNEYENPQSPPRAPQPQQAQQQRRQRA